MLELTDSARKELESYFAGKEKSDIRIYLAPGGCCGPHLALALDAATDEDQSEEPGRLYLLHQQGSAGPDTRRQN